MTNHPSSEAFRPEPTLDQLFPPEPAPITLMPWHQAIENSHWVWDDEAKSWFRPSIVMRGTAGLFFKRAGGDKLIPIPANGLVWMQAP